jgi:hypothetical protein
MFQSSSHGSKLHGRTVAHATEDGANKFSTLKPEYRHILGVRNQRFRGIGDTHGSGVWLERKMYVPFPGGAENRRKHTDRPYMHPLDSRTSSEVAIECHHGDPQG